MANVTITIPDAVLLRVVTALCVKESLPISNANAKQTIINIIKRIIKDYESLQASQTAMNNASQDVDNNIILS